MAGYSRPPSPTSFEQGLGRWTGLLDEVAVDDVLDLGDLPDSADLHEQVGSFAGEGLQFAGEKLLVCGLVLPAQIFGRAAKLFTSLFDVATHDFIGLGLLLADHFQGLKIAC